MYSLQFNQLNINEEDGNTFELEEEPSSSSELHVQLAYSSNPDTPIDLAIVSDSHGIQVFSVASDGTKIKIPFIPKEHCYPLPDKAKQVLIQHPA